MRHARWPGRIGFALILLLAAAPAARGQKWASDMFDHTSHDFVTVARGAKVEHRFKFENIYVEDVHVAWLRTACQCTTPRVTKDTLKTWETAEVVVTLDTRRFLGRKDATITVKFDKPFEAEVQLQVHCNIRGDVVVQQGSVDFGSLPQGSGAEQHATISYAGRHDWKILRVESANPNLSGKVTESSRALVEGVWRVDYDLLVTLKKTTPEGYIRNDVVLVTDDANPQSVRVPVPIEAVIRPAVAVNPSPMMMPSIAPGDAITRPLIVHGNTPFHILSVKCDDKRFQCVPPSAANLLHRLPVTFTAAADEKPGRASTTVHIATDARAIRRSTSW